MASSTDSSAILSLPYIQPGQAQKHVTHNEALQKLDVLVQMVVEGFGAEIPPAAPAEGEMHALGPAPTGLWAGQPDMLAVWTDAAWRFIAPRPGWRAWGRAEAELRVWDGGAWALLRADVENLPGLGIGTASDPVNRLAVKSPATLLSHDGTDHRLKINKAAAGDTGSVLFQSGWTGHAEIGLAGDTDFTLRVSGDGGTWAEALRADATGRIGIGGAAPSAALDVAGDSLRLRTSRTPASSSAPGSPGEICWDGGYIYVCVAPNSWARAALSSW